MNTVHRLHSPNPCSQPSSRSKAFTLVEILAVLAVIAAIVAVGVPAIAKVLQSARIRNVEGTATVVKAAITQFMSKPGSSGSIPVTEGGTAAMFAEYTGLGTPTAAAVAAAATLDNVLLTEGVMERPMGIRMGSQNGAAAGTANGFTWAPTTQSFTATAAPTISYAAMSRIECAVSDGSSNPGATGQGQGSAACAFNISGASMLTSGTRVAYLIVKNTPDADAYQLALDVDGVNLMQNTVTSPAGADQTQGQVVYAKDASGAGFVDVYYYIASI